MTHSPRAPRPPTARRRTVRGLALSTAALVVTGLTAVLLPHAAVAATTTHVSLTFDDGWADQVTASQTLSSKGLVGTFYINSGTIDAPGYLTRANLATIAASGNEIGGHSVTHPDLTTLSTDEAKRQVCTDRATLTGWGYTVTSFAYPFAAATAATEQVAKGCGYNSARGLGDIQTRFGCTGCPLAETLPPADPYYTKVPDEVDSTWTLADLQSTVTTAEAGGGWIALTFHHVGVDGDPLSVSSALFDQFTTWLAARSASGTVVQTVQQVLGGATRPLVAAPAVPAPTAGANGVKNPSLETAGTTALPQCWMAGGYGVNTPTFATTTTRAAAHTGTRAETLTMAGYSSDDAKLLPTLDLGGCAPSATPGHTYSMRTWFKASTVTQFEVYLRTGVGTWSYWTSSPYFAASAAYTQAVWTTPAIPAGATGISFGLNLFGNGTLSTDDYALYDTVGAPAVTAVRSGSILAALVGVLAKIVLAPLTVLNRVIAHSPLYAPAATSSAAPATARSERHAPAAPRAVHLVPGPQAVAGPFVLEEGAITG